MPVLRDLAWVLALALFLSIRWPLGVLRRLSRAQRWQLALTALACTGVIAFIKHFNHTSCPWDLKV